MIYLTNPLLHQGRIIPAGELVRLEPEFEAAIVAAGNAECFDEEDPPEEDPPEEDPPEDDPEVLLGRTGQ